MLSVRYKVITISDFHCIYLRQNLDRFFIDFGWWKFIFQVKLKSIHIYNKTGSKLQIQH